MNDIVIHYNGRTPQVEQAEEIVSGQIGTVAVRFTFSPEWDAYPVKNAAFLSSGGACSVPLDETGSAVIPEKVIQRGVRTFSVSAFGNGKNEDGEIVRYNGKETAFRVQLGGATPENAKPEGAASAYEILLVRIEGKVNENQGAENAGRVLVVGEDGKVRPGEYAGGGGTGGGGVNFRPDETLTLSGGVLSVNTADAVEEDNTLPVTSAAVYTTVGNIEALLKTI